MPPHEGSTQDPGPSEPPLATPLVIGYVQLLGGQNRYGLVWAVNNPPELPVIMKKFEMMHILQAQVCGCIRERPGMPHQKSKRETSDASKSQVDQASCNRTILKFGSENQ